MAQEQSVFQNLKQVSRNAYTFTLSPTDVSFANTLRRLILTGVEVVGFRSDMNEKGSTTDVEILKNTTPMTNEMLADRIGLLPIHNSDPAQFNPDKYIFRLSVSNDSSDPRDITASDIEVFQLGENGEETKVPNVQFFPPDPVSGETALLSVLKGKRAGQVEVVEFRAKASRGTGREHARFMPVSQCAYKYTRDSNESRIEELFTEWLANKKYLKPGQDVKTMEAEKLAMYRREYNTMEIDRCYLQNEKGEPYSFDFIVESVGSSSVPSIVKRALEAGIVMCQKYINLDKEQLPLNVKETPAANRLEGFDYLFEKEDHTLGNLFQSYIDVYLMDGSKVTYVGYKVPHPLRDEMVLRVGVNGEAINARKVVAEAARGCVAMFSGWLNAWKAITGERQQAPLQPVQVVRGSKVMVKRAATKKQEPIG